MIIYNPPDRDAIHFLLPVSYTPPERDEIDFIIGELPIQIYCSTEAPVAEVFGVLPYWLDGSTVAPLASSDSVVVNTIAISGHTESLAEIKCYFGITAGTVSPLAEINAVVSNPISIKGHTFATAETDSTLQVWQYCFGGTVAPLAETASIMLHGSLINCNTDSLTEIDSFLNHIGIISAATEAQAEIHAVMEYENNDIIKFRRCGA